MLLYNKINISKQIGYRDTIYEITVLMCVCLEMWEEQYS